MPEAVIYISFNPAYNSIRYWTREGAERARLEQETGALATPYFATPALTDSHLKVVRDLIELARRVHLALDDSEEQQGQDGRQHAIDGQHFDDLCEAIDHLEDLPDDKPGEIMGPSSKAEWALRQVLVPDGGIEAELRLLRKRVATYEAREALGWIPAPTHPDDAAVDEFAADLKAKLAKARAKGRSGWEDTAKVDQLDLAMELRQQLHKGDPLDVAALAMMLHMRGESTKLPPLSQDLVKAIKDAPAGSSVIEHGGATIFVSRDSDHSAPILGMIPPGSELRAQVVKTANLAGEIQLQMCNGAEVPQDLESGMVVDVLYTPASSGGAA
ncbi:hypothetical protein ACIGHN_13550 [Acidovorax sp. NPDC077693]|uniref:hypothetical protein n=1 Tax=unclassified Acidovorax TaxID=2684926 RepID=UPI0037C66BC6